MSEQPADQPATTYTRSVEVVIEVDFTVDPSKFTPEFMAGFARDFFDYDTLDEHLGHLAQLCARGVA